MKLITELNFDDVKCITEEKEGGKKSYFLEGIYMQAGIVNKNKRFYPVEIVENEVNRYNESHVTKNRAFGELGHPSGPTINLERTSHLIKSLRKEGNDFIGRAKVLDTPYGNIVKNLIDEGATIGVSSRSTGTLKANKQGIMEIQNDLKIATAADVVADPSAPAAFVNGILESKNWVFESGVWKEEELENAGLLVKRSHKIDKEDLALKIFEHFLGKL